MGSRTLLAVLTVFFLSSTVGSVTEAKFRGSLAVHPDEEIERMTNDLFEAVQAQHHSHRARTRMSDILATIRLPEQLQFSEEDKHTSVTCRLCKTVGGAVIKLLREDNSTTGQLYDTISTLCARAHVTTEEICRGMVHSNGPLFTYLAKNTPGLNGPLACGVMIPDCYSGVDSLDWTLDLSFLGRKPKKHISSLMARKSKKKKKQTGDEFRILQVTDYHWDPKYAPGSNVKCSEPTCCRNKTDLATSQDNRAGWWGDYRNCDVPWTAVEELHRHTKEKQKFDVVYFTGDIIDHGVWETSRAGNGELIKKTMKSLKDTYGNTMVIPILGNHEPHPINVFAPDSITNDEVSSRWLYEILVETWSDWLPEDTHETILRGGFYTVLVRPGFRVVALNNMFCYNMNWWVLHDPRDPSGQLMWLANVLLKAEDAGEKVHILEHVAPGSSDCLEAWSREYARIVERFSDTITAHFYGHTHKDDFRIFYDKSGVPNNVAFNGGSLTTYSDVNPNYKIYTVETNSWEVQDTETWIFNLTEANKLQEGESPNWYKLYSFKDAFGVSSMHPVHLENFVKRLATDKELQQTFHRYYMLDSDVGVRDGCNEWCAKDLVCKIVTTVTRNTKQCEKFKNLKVT